MAASRSDPCEIDRLFTRSVPHILENIFFRLDYTSFSKCREVCKGWNELFTSDLYRKEGEDILRDERLVLNASRDGNVAEVKRLLLKGVSPNFKDHLGSTSLTEATIRRDTNMIEWLLNMGANPDMSDSSGRTALCIAREKWQTDTVKLLLRKGADPKKASGYPNPILHWAISIGETEMIKLVLDGGIDPNVTDRSGRTALCIAKEKWQKDTVK